VKRFSLWSWRAVAAAAERGCEWKQTSEWRTQDVAAAAETCAVHPLETT